ncbi:MAG TPA: class I SAM-dependent methyltransferase [Gammaproteobacteria bacterium]|nr:class I SAM-dependent methyltransferase [Gammaproteobacteria bacterium]
MSNSHRQTLDDWLSTPLGRRCIANEQRLVRRALECVFGEQLLQVGSWGGRGAFLRYARTQRKALVDWSPCAQADVVCDSTQLALAADSVDAVILPHTLERIPSPHALLREVDRVLRPDGQLIVLSFTPTGPWGIRHLFSPGGYPVGQKRMIREGRLRDWLELLSFEVGSARRYCHTLPFEQFRRLGTLPKEEWAQRWLPMLCGGYLLHAQKRVRTVTPIRPAWRQPRLRAVGGLEPSTRVAPLAHRVPQEQPLRPAAQCAVSAVSGVTPIASRLPRAEQRAPKRRERE